MTDNSTPREGLLAIGTTLANGKYRIEKYLASGGFGNTYMAIDTAFDERVAIKELFIKGVCGRMDNATDISISLTENQRTFNAQREKFRKEARRLRKLENKHIVRVHDLFDENGTTYYVMDFIEGESLSTRLKRTHQPMTEAEVLPILAQVLDALETVHNEGIWHLDLKPANIMVDDKDNVQLIDFGASKQLRNADGNSLHFIGPGLHSWLCPVRTNGTEHRKVWSVDRSLRARCHTLPLAHTATTALTIRH